MNLCVFLAIGETWEEFQKNGQDQLLINNNLYFYSKSFDNVYVLSYGKLDIQIYPNVYVLSNKYKLHRFLYACLLPFLYFNKIKHSSILRGMQITGGIPAMIAGIFYGKPAIANFGYDYVSVSLHEKKYLQSLLFKVLERVLISNFDGIIVTTKNLMSHVQNYREKDIYLIPNSVDTNFFKPLKVKKKQQVIFVGRLEKQKNIQLLISALGCISAKNITLLCIGSGSQAKNLLRMSKEQNVRLRILKPKPHTKLVTYYNESQLFVLPSFVEGHPKAMLEAMSCGLPVIGTNITGINDLIEDRKTGLLCSFDKYDLAAKITSLLNKKRFAKSLGKNARKKVAIFYNRDKVWKKEVDLLKKLVVKAK